MYSKYTFFRPSEEPTDWFNDQRIEKKKKKNRKRKEKETETADSYKILRQNDRKVERIWYKENKQHLEGSTKYFFLFFFLSMKHIYMNILIRQSWNATIIIYLKGNGFLFLNKHLMMLLTEEIPEKKKPQYQIDIQSHHIQRQAGLSWFTLKAFKIEYMLKF